VRRGQWLRAEGVARRRTERRPECAAEKTAEASNSMGGLRGRMRAREDRSKKMIGKMKQSKEDKYMTNWYCIRG